jgi:hypothetical protein
MDASGEKVRGVESLKPQPGLSMIEQTELETGDEFMTSDRPIGRLFPRAFLFSEFALKQSKGRPVFSLNIEIEVLPE